MFFFIQRVCNFACQMNFTFSNLHTNQLSKWFKMVQSGVNEKDVKNICIFCCSSMKCENAKLSPFILFVKTKRILCCKLWRRWIHWIHSLRWYVKKWMRAQRSTSAIVSKRIWIAMAGIRIGWKGGVDCNRRLTNMYFNVMHTLYCVSSHTNQFPLANVIN